MPAPTLINLPPAPPSDPVTPSEIPGTPNSGTTTMSELSTVAIKDGHRGHPHHHAHNRLQAVTSDTTTADTADAERADRISRLPGLERAHTVRQTPTNGIPTGATALNPHGYFDQHQHHGSAYHKERSTVGSASATGSVGGRTTWASGSDMYDGGDKTSEDQDHDMDASSVGGFSEEGNGSLVGFGEGAGSTVSGPISTGMGVRTLQRQSGAFSGRASAVPPHVRETPTGRDVRMMDGVTYESGGADAAHSGTQLLGHQSRSSMTGAEQAEQIMGGGSFDTGSGLQARTDRRLGNFGFEDGK